MNIVIIEDEPLVADELEQNLITLLGNNTQITKLESVKEAVCYFEAAAASDLQRYPAWRRAQF